jgi:hypothetical protein
LFDSFEEPGLPWSASGLWHPEGETEPCGSLVAPFPSPTTAWYYGDQAYGCSYDTGAPNEGYLTLDATLPITGARYATLRFWSYEQTQCQGSDPDCPYDWRFLEVSYDEGATWTRLRRSVTEDAWYPVTVSTHVEPGDSLRLRFFFDSIDDAYNDYLGWFLDDVEVTACVEGVTPAVFVGNIKLKFRVRDPGPPPVYKVLGRVPIYDEALNPVVRATVTAAWTLPHGRTVVQTAVTRPNGATYFRLTSRQEGVYRLTVLDVHAAGYVYDPDQNYETSEELQVP